MPSDADILNYPPAVLLTDLLRDVSRSFYLTLRVLPAGIRRQIGLAYLLARTSDTIADTQIIPVEARLDTLQKFREHILGATQALPDLKPFVLQGEEKTNAGSSNSGSRAERILLTRVEPMLEMLEQFAVTDQELIRTVLSKIIQGQELDLKRFGGLEPGQLVALQTELELDDYIYRVAGCVGEFWTKICRHHVFPRARLDEKELLERGIRFGKGLQLVNILRDLPSDLRQGRCYIPQPLLEAGGLTPKELLHPANETKFRPVYDRLLESAQEHLAAGWAYTNALPRGCIRLRLACAWPILIGVQTIVKLKKEPVLQSEHRVKVSRSEVKRLVLQTTCALAWPPAWRRLFTNASRS